MHPRHYLCKEIFELEQERLFRKLWIFGGLRTMLRNNNDFITRTVAGIPVVIQNFEGELRAFENVCLHRGARLQSKPWGQRPLVCPYHCWKYGVSGEPNTIPFHDELYRFPQEERSNLRLRQFPMQAVGNILFVNLSTSPIPIEQQFTREFLDLLESSSHAYDGEVMMTTFRTRFNWKLGYENLRDANHVPFVHSKTLARNVSFQNTVDEVRHLQAAQNAAREMGLTDRRDTLRRFSVGGPEGVFKHPPRFDWHSYVDRWGKQDSYFNWLAYPNLHISSSDGGYSFSIEHHVPVAPDRTDLEIYWMTARKTRPYASSVAVLRAMMNGSKVVVGEDVEIMEEVQAAMHKDAPVAQQGDYEGFNKVVEQWYVDVIDNNHEF